MGVLAVRTSSSAFSFSGLQVLHAHALLDVFMNATNCKNGLIVVFDFLGV
jgi:hypothetical protein